MTFTKEIQITTAVFDLVYDGDSINLYDKLLGEFEIEHPDKTIMGAEDILTIENEIVFYNITIEYE